MGTSWGVGIDTDGLTVTMAGGVTQTSVPQLVAFGPGDVPAVGREAMRLTAAGYPAYRDVVGHTGDPVHGSDGSARLGADLTAAAVVALVRTVSAGGPAGHVVVAGPPTWRDPDVAELQAALARTGCGGRYTLVSRPVAAVTQLVAEGRLRVGARVAVVDVARTATTLALVAVGEEGAHTVVAVGRIDDFGAEVLDHALLRLVLDRADPVVAEPLRHDRRARPDLVELVAACGTARRELETLPSTSVQVRCGERLERVRVTRAELETEIREPVRRAVTAIVPNLGVRENAADWDGVVLLGDAAGTPAVTGCVRVELGATVLLGAAPDRTVTRGAARLASGARRLVADGGFPAADSAGAPVRSALIPVPVRQQIRARAVVVGVLATIAVAVGGAVAVDAGSSHAASSYTATIIP